MPPSSILCTYRRKMHMHTQTHNSVSNKSTNEFVCYISLIAVFQAQGMKATRSWRRAAPRSY